MSPRHHCAVVTGAAGGIGRAIVRQLAPRCDSMILVGRDASSPAAVALSAGATGTRVRAVTADLATREGQQAVQDAAEAAGGIDLLVNNAGASEFAWLVDQDDAVLERIVRVNVLVPMQLTRRLLPLLLAQPAATVVNVGSIFGYLGYPGHAAYCASKFALRGLSEALRRELADGPVRVLYLAPRATRTDMNSAATCALNAELGVRMDPPESVAAALVALLDKPVPERLLGMPERLFALLNRIMPRMLDHALRRQLPVIRRHARKDRPQPVPQGGNP
jgi:short-subunit dehydrogenase